MTKRVDDLKLLSLQILGVVGAGQAASAEDVTALDVEASAERLAAERVIDLTGDVLADDIPRTFLQLFAIVVAADHAAQFGADIAKFTALRDRAVADIGDIVRRDQPAPSLRCEYLGI